MTDDFWGLFGTPPIDMISSGNDFSATESRLPDMCGMVPVTDAALLERTEELESECDSTEKFCSLGFAYLELGFFDKSQKAFDNALAMDPLCSEANYGRGLLFMKEGRYGQAKQEFIKRIKREPDDVPAYNMLGRAYLRLNNASEAEMVFRKALKLSPYDSLTLNNIGLSLESLGRKSESIDFFRSALLANPEYTGARNNLGRVLTEAEMYREAEQEFLKILAWSPFDDTAYHNLGVLYHRRYRYDDALRCFSRAIEIDPLDTYPKNAAGTICMELGKYELAIDYFNSALRIHPSDSKSLANRALCLVRMGRIGDAEKDAERASMEGSYEGAACCGAIKLINENFSDSLRYFKLASSYKNPDICVLVGASICLLELGRPEEALECSELALRAEPENPYALNSCAEALIACGRFESGEKMLLKSEKINPVCIQTLSSLAFEYFLSGNYCKSAEYYLKLTSVCPDSSEIFNSLGVVYSAMGRQAEAESQWRHALLLDASFVPAIENLRESGGLGVSPDGVYTL